MIRHRRGSGRMRSLVFLLLASFLAPFLAGTFGGPALRRALAAPGDHKYVSLRGRVVDDAGNPVPDVRIEASGTREGIALTGGDGRFAITLDLGAMRDLLARPAIVRVRARLAGHRVVLPGGQHELAFEVRVGERARQPVIEARSNFGLIAEAILDALAPVGERTAVLQVRFVARRGVESDSTATLPTELMAVNVDEPWLLTPSAAKNAPRETAPVQSGPVATPRAPEPAERAPGESGRTSSRTSGRANTGTPPSSISNRAPQITRDARQRSRIEAARAERDSLFNLAQARARAKKAADDAIRARRAATEDSIRRARLGARVRARANPASRLGPAPDRAEAKMPPPAAPRAAAPASAGATEPRAAVTPREDPAPPRGRASTSRRTDPRSSRVTAPPTAPSGLQRVESRPGASGNSDSDEEERLRLEADSCGCTIRGTVELEFHRLLTTPMRIEVAVKELPAIRDTIELFMGSPRAFEMRRVPCGRWSLSLRPFSERPFGVTTPEEVAPFDCRQRALRQVRIVIAPL